MMLPRMMKWTPALLLLCAALLIVSCTPGLNPTTYTFDFTAENEPLIIPHNAILALTFDKTQPTISSRASSLITTYQTKIGCWDDQEELYDFWQEDLSTQLHLRDSIPATKMTLALPYRLVGGSMDKPGTLCVGTYSQDQGWTWDYTAISARLDDTAEQGSTEIELSGSRVAAVAILFDTTTSVGKVTVETLE